LAQEPSLQTAPTIPFESVPDFLKLPPDLFLGEAAGVAVNSKGHVFVFSRRGTSGPAYGAAAAQLLEFDADGKFVREIGRTSMRGPSPTPSASTRTTTSGLSTRARTWWSSSIPTAGS
jgi:hypothetical protein